MSLSYNPKSIPLSKALRKAMTPQERKLWYCFLRRSPIRFQRQKPVSEYILDFYCAKAKLAIELDGSQHRLPNGLVRDEQRTQALHALGIHLIRFSNQQVDAEFEEVCRHIGVALNEALLCENPN